MKIDIEDLLQKFETDVEKLALDAEKYRKMKDFKTESYCLGEITATNRIINELKRRIFISKI